MAEDVLEAVQATRQCRATNRAGRRCSRSAIRGGFVCKFHGGGAPQVKAKAEQRLRKLVDPMLGRLHELAMQNDHLPTAGKMVQDALDRAGIGELVQAKIRQSHAKGHGSQVVVNIGFLTNASGSPDVEVQTLELPSGDADPMDT